MHQPRTKEAGRGVFENNKCRFFNAGTMALLSPARRDDRHADHRRRCHAGHHDDNGPSPPPPHSKLSFLLFDFTFGQEFHLSRLTLAVVQQQLGEQVQGDLQIPLWQLPRPQSLSCNKEMVGEEVGKVWFGLVQEDVEEKERNDYRQGSEDSDFPSYR